MPIYFICSLSTSLFIDNFLNLINQYSPNIQDALLKYLKMTKKSSIVRKIGSQITWISAQRTHLCTAQKESDEKISSSEGGFLQELSLDGEHTHEYIKYSALIEDKVKDLEKELLYLQEQVTKILSNQDKKMWHEEIKLLPNGTSEDVSYTSCESTHLPPPPPPPPPLPPTPINHTRSLLVKVVPKKYNLENRNDPPSNLFEELSKRPPKLRHVELSPGGRPLRKTPNDSNPSELLIAVLKKRFEAIHGHEQEKSVLSPLEGPESPKLSGH